MDLVGYSKSKFDAIVADFLALNDRLSFPKSFQSHRRFVGQHHRHSNWMPWYDGPTLLDHLETVDTSSSETGPLRLPVQYVIRPSQVFTAMPGAASGVLGVARRSVLPSGKETVINGIYVGQRDVTKAVAGQSSPSLSMANSTSRGVT